MDAPAETFARIDYEAIGVERFRQQVRQRRCDGAAVGSERDSTAKHRRSDCSSRPGDAPAEFTQSASCIDCACEAARGRALDAIVHFGKLTGLLAEARFAKDEDVVIF